MRFAKAAPDSRLRLRQWGCSSPILFITAIFLALGLAALAAWQLTGSVAWVERFFRVPGAILQVWLAAVELWLSVRVLQQYAAGEPMRTAWKWIALSAVADLISAVLVQILPFRPELRQLGHLVGGPVRFAPLAAGLFSALKVYRRAGFIGRLRSIDWVLLLLAGAYVALEAAGVQAAIRGGKDPSLLEILHWPVDPLLWLLLGEAALLRRSVQRMGMGSVSKCWKAFSVGVFLVTLGNLTSLAHAYGYLVWPWSSVEWYLWLPAACAFALAPAYQLEAIQQASATP